MIERLLIESMGHRGDGIAAAKAGPVFVPYALPGETVEAEPAAGQPDRYAPIRIVDPSPDRIAPECLHFGICGGCATQHWRLAPYLAWKRGLVVEALRQAGLDAPVDDAVDAHGAGRRRVTLHARGGEIGFMAAHTHQLVPIVQCPVLAPALAGTLPAARAIAQTLGTAKPLDIQITATDTGLDVDVRGSGALKPAQTAALAQLAERHGLARLTRHGEMIAQRAEPMLMIGRARVALPPGAFLQATTEGEDTLVRLVAEHAGKAKRIADLFCGIGTFTLRLAERARVLAADSDAAAVNALKRATAPGLKPIDAQARDLFRRPLQAMDFKGVEAVVFDPPRQGAEAQVREIAAAAVPVVIAVSCNPATFARDARSLVDAGYALTRVTPVDQFRYSAHVELVGRLEKR